MNEAEKIAAEVAAKAAIEAAKVVIEPVIETDIIAERDARIAKLEEERDNYKNVALKRLGKLPADSEFLGENGGDIQALIEDKVKTALIEREITLETKAKEDEFRKAQKTISELRLALKNRPGGSIGGEGGSSVEVKDNVFSPEQIMALKAKATRLHADPEKFIEKARQNLLLKK